MEWYKVPNKVVAIIPEGRKGRLTFAGEGGDAWKSRLKDKFAKVFAKGLGTCRSYVVQSFPWAHPLPWKQQATPLMSRPLEEDKVL